MIDTTRLEPEGPFGESHGHIALEEFNMPMRVTAITHRRDAIVASYLSQVTPSESSAIKRVAYEPMFLAHLNKTLGIKGVTRVTLHERMTALRRITIITVAEGHAAHRDLARALRRDVVQGRLRQDLHRGERGHRSRQFGRAVLGDGVSHGPARRPAGAALPQPGPRAGARARSASTRIRRSSWMRR